MVAISSSYLVPMDTTDTAPMDTWPAVCIMSRIAEQIAHCPGSYNERPCALVSTLRSYFQENSWMDANKTWTVAVTVRWNKVTHRRVIQRRMRIRPVH